MEQERLVSIWIEECESELQVVADELAEATRKHTQLRTRLDMLLGLRASFETTTEGNNEPEAHEPRDFELFNGRRRGGVRERIVTHTREILEDYGRSLHISEIAKEFDRRGYEIPGKGESVNITAHLVRTDEVVSTGWGMYGLPEWQEEG